MLKNYFITAWRSLRSRPLFAFINITGLTLGLAFAGAIGIYVFENFQVDRTQPDNVYRVITAYQTATVNGKFPTVGRALLPAIEAEIPEVQYVVPMYKAYLPLKRESNYYFDDVVFAGEHFFDVFNFPLLYGDIQTALSTPYTAVLSKPMAKKYFGNTEVIGKTMMVQDSIPCTITGVLDDLPASHVNFDVLLSFATWQRMQGDMTAWFTWDMTCYVSLTNGVNPAIAERKISALSMAHNGDEFRSNGYDVSHQLEAVGDIYLHSSLPGLNMPAGNVTQLYILSAIGLSLLVLACINFINLTTALLADRAKEVGVRKTLGATAGGLTSQFMVETLFMVFLASLLAVGLVLVLLPVISQLSNQQISYRILLLPSVATGWLLLMGITTLFAGGYPAFALSKLQPVSAIKNNSSHHKNGFSLRRVLVIFQFTVTLVLITGTFIGVKQLDYMRHKDLGFRKDEVAVIS
ncbi:MAG TPA: ABC transporter permease, partial [Parapedobacter sp.]|nr:ABC transporter permease [Parapedobacter sp.]